jgi:M6 family metalloprotease-like protein
MTRLRCRWLFVFVLLAGTPWLLSHADLASAQGPAPAAEDLADYRTVETAVTARISQAGPAATVAAGVLGVHVTPNDQGQLVIAHVQDGSPAARAGLQEGDLLTRLGDQTPRAPDDLKQFLQGKAAGEVVKLQVQRRQETVEVSATLAAPSRPLAAEQAEAPRGKGGWDARRTMRAWKKNTYRLAVVSIDYPDVKHNEAITTKHWEESLFSRNKYVEKSATGQAVYGSLADYYHEQSYGTLKVEGKVFPYVKVSKNRQEYGQAQGPRKSALLTEALDKLLEREGKDALKDFDGIFFMFAGGRAQSARGGLYWPHKSNVMYKGKSWPYFICPEGGGRMGNISVICHEFGHMLGLPDLYARPENPGSEGLGIWCAMSNQAPNGRPQHFSAWCKEQLGWIKPAVIDPTTRQKLILAPIYKSPQECYKVLARADGSEYYLLENRGGKGFDTSLPASGLLVWRVVRNRPILEESHGIAGPAGPRLFPASVPFPSKSNDAFTPFTVPSSRSQLGSGLPVHITNIRRLPDGRIAFLVGWEFF